MDVVSHITRFNQSQCIGSGNCCSTRNQMSIWCNRIPSNVDYYDVIGEENGEISNEETRARHEEESFFATNLVHDVASKDGPEEAAQA